MLARLLADLIAPATCHACGAPGDGLCPDCRADLPWLRGPRCARCGLPAGCASGCTGAIDQAWAPMAFEGPARALVHALKFRGALALADLMAAQMVALSPAGLLAAGAVLVPVPTHPARRRRRGFCHAERLAAAVGARTGLEVARCLVRAGPPTRQAGAGRAARTVGGRIVVGVRPRVVVPPSVVLVDDVHTTGATLEACASALCGKGARRVVALTYARALR